MIFASPDFGAAGMACLVMIGTGCFLFVIAGLCFNRGIVLLRRPVPRGRLGWALVTVGVLTPVTVCTGPSIAFRLAFGRGPISGFSQHFHDRARFEGKSEGEIRAMFGDPHEAYSPGEITTWVYYGDALGLDAIVFYFGVNGRVAMSNFN